MCKHTQHTQLPLCSTSEQSYVDYSMSTKDNMQKLVYRNIHEETRPLLP